MPETQSKKQLMVDFEPIGRRAQVLPGQTLLEAARSAGIDLVSVCGGHGSCDSCSVRLMGGRLNPPTLKEQDIFEPEDLAAGSRLACQSIPETDVKVDVPPESLATSQRLQIEGQEVETTGARVIESRDLQIEPPSLNDLRSDTSRLRSALERAGVEAIRFSLPVLGTISDVLREDNWRVRAALRGSLVVALLPAETQLVGLAVDVGTTKVAGYLLDLESGETLSKTGVMNPQISYGEDVVSRITYADSHPDGRHELQSRLVLEINRMLEGLYTQVGISAQQVVEAVLVGNTAMHHLLAGLPVHQLAMAPFVPAVSEALELSAGDLGLAIAPGAMVYFPPNIAGFVGADHVAMILSTDLWKTQQTEIALDIGTNTEITLAHHGRLLCCSCASGPAFEGAHIRDGMRAAPGAIERVRIIDGRPMVFTIGGKEPIGICGSGILDAVSELIKAGIVDTRGSIDESAPRVSNSEDSNHRQYLLVPAAESGHGRDVIILRSDVKEIQLAKGAIRAGIEMLLAEADIQPGDIESFIVAGAFGTYLDIESAVTVGMFPDLPRDRFQQVGNAAGTGARQMLISASRREAADLIRSRIEYIELTAHPDFEKRFIGALSFDRPQ